MLLLMVERRIFLGNDLNGLRVLSSMLRGPPSWASALRFLPSRRQVGGLLPGAIPQAQCSVGLIVLTYFAVHGVCSQVRLSYM